MKISLLTLCACLFFAFPSEANNGPATTPDTKFSKIFFQDLENQVIYVDFEAIGLKVTDVNLLSTDRALMEDDVRGLPSNTIYEIDLERLSTGSYTIELRTTADIIIQKKVTIE